TRFLSLTSCSYSKCTPGRQNVPFHDHSILRIEISKAGQGEKGPGQSGIQYPNGHNIIDICFDRYADNGSEQSLKCNWPSQTYCPNLWSRSPLSLITNTRIAQLTVQPCNDAQAVRTAVHGSYPLPCMPTACNFLAKVRCRCEMSKGWPGAQPILTECGVGAT